MCGITGLFALSPDKQYMPSEIQTMMAAISHRGPDGEGYYLDQGVALGHLRLSIVDISGGHQPMKSADDQMVLTYNGEIYNAAALREQLEAAGYQFKTSHSDTEVLLYSYAHWGTDCVRHLRGMFAFAIWDAAKDQLFLARDRLGIKPLYYGVNEDSFAFSSELKGVLPLKGIDKRIHPQALEDYLTLGYVPDPKTIIVGARKLPPAHAMTVKRGALIPDVWQYWDVDFTAPDPDLAAEQALLDQLDDAVRARLMADVPVGAFLSGGVDSSAVVSLMARAAPVPINSFSIGVEDIDYDESDYADRIAQKFSTKHHVRYVDPAQGLDTAELARVYSEPFADSSAIPTLKVCALAKETVKVALSGDGGDEVFLGYRRQLFHLKEHKLRRLIPYMVRRPVFGLLGKVYPKFDFLPRFLRAKTTFEALSMTDAEAYCHTVSKTPRRVMAKLRSRKFKKALRGYRTRDLFQKLYDQAPALTELARIKYIDLKTFLAGGVLTKVDRASMYHGVEVRVPILDHHFIEWASKVPDGQQLVGGQGKSCLKKALEPLIDHDILYRPKQGFSIPVESWLRSELREKLLSLPQSEILHQTGYLNMRVIAKLIDGHLSLRQNNADVLWALLMLEESLRYLSNAD